MANSRRGNKIYIDTTGAISTKREKVAYIIFTPDSSNDQVVFRETGSDVDILILRGSVGKESMFFDFALVPMVFGNGIYVQTLTTGAKVVLVTTEKGE